MKVGALRIVGGQTCEALVKEVCTWCGVEVVPVRYGRHVNDNQYVRLEADLAGADVYIVQTTRPPVDFHVMQLLFLLEAARRHGAARLTVAAPYFPYVRSNGHTPGDGIWARLVADLMTVAGATTIIAFDLIARQVQGFAHRLVNLETRELLAKSVRSLLSIQDRDDVVVVAPDMLPIRSAFEFSYRLGVPFAGVIYLERQSDGRRILRADGQPVRSALLRDIKHKTVVLYDDEIDTGETMCRATEIVLSMGAKEVVAASPHAVLCGNAMETLQQSQLSKIVITNTIPILGGAPEKFVVVSVGKMLADAILRLHYGS